MRPLDSRRLYNTSHLWTPANRLSDVEEADAGAAAAAAAATAAAAALPSDKRTVLTKSAVHVVKHSSG